MHLIAWVLAGLIAGFIASRVVNQTGKGLLLDILLGIAGGVAGGWVAGILGFQVRSGFNVPSVMVAVIGGVVILMIYHGIQRNG